MNATVFRTTSLLARNAIKSSLSVRAFSSIGTRILASNLTCQINKNKDFLALTPKLCLNATRLYSSEKFTPTQIEEKVLDIIKNFDRIKENPAKLEVIVCRAKN